MSVRPRTYAWYVLALLTAINFVNYVDRQIIVGMYDDFRTRFHMTNGQIGALTTAFFTVHALTTVPFGWAADRFDRRKIAALAVIGWSLATLGSAYAVGFLSLLLLRGAIGVGEAAYLPVSNTILCEVFPDSKAKSLGIFNGGMFAGACVGVAVGGLIGFPTAFQIVAVPGLVLGVMVMFLRVPPHRDSKLPTMRLRDSFRPLDRRTLHWMLAGGILVSFTAGGYISWFADFIVRDKGMDKNTAVLVLGGIVLTGGALGAITGGWVADRLQRRWRFGRTITVALGFFLAIPFALLAIFVDRGWLFFLSAWLLMFFLPWYNGPMAAVIDDVVDDGEASTAQASFSFVLHLVGTGPASMIVGYAADGWGSLRLALLLPTGATLLAGVCCLVACRHVDADMRRRAERAAALSAVA